MASSKAKKNRVTLNDVMGKESHVEVDFSDIQGGTINVWYDPTKITRRMVDIVDQTDEDTSEWAHITSGLERIAIRWDLYLDDEAKSPVPLDKEGLMDVPVGVLARVWWGIINHYVPKYLTGMITPGSSAQTEDSEPLPNGTTSSQ